MLNEDEQLRKIDKATDKALLLDLSKWDDCKSENMDSMSIDSVEELEDER